MSTVTATVTPSPGDNVSITSAPYGIKGQESSGGGSGFDPGGVQYSRMWATSAYVVGAVPIWTVAGMSQGVIKVYTYESSTSDQSDLQADLQALIDAFTAPLFTLQFNIGDATYKWQCYCADYVTDKWPMETVFGLALGTTFTFPRQPIALEGPV